MGTTTPSGALRRWCVSSQPGWSGSRSEPRNAAPAPRRAWKVAGLIILSLLALAALPARAELVIFTNGRVLRTESFEVVGDKARMELEAGGAVWVSLSLIGRVVDHEVELTPEERRMMALELGSGPQGAAPIAGLPGGDVTFEAGPAGELDPAESDPARSIAGRVLDEAGEPVPGIEVTARTIRLFQESAPGPTGARPEIAARSAADGSYRFGQLAQGEYGLRTLPTDRYTSAQTVVRTGVDFANLVVREERPLAIHGLVTSTEGEPLRGVRVTPVGKSAAAAVSTDSRGSYALEIPVSKQARIHTLRFELEEYRERALSLSDTQILGRSEIQLDATLERLASLAPVAGRVSDGDGAPVAGETVHLVGAERYQAVTDEAGAFSMPEVETGASYRLWVSPRGPYRPYRKEVRVAAEGLDVNVVLESEPLEYGSLAGRMLDVSGNPVPHFSLWLRSSNPSARQPMLVTSDGSGQFSVGEVPAGRLSLTSQANPQFTVSGIDLSRGGAETADLILDWGRYEVRGRVVDGYGNPVAAPQVTLQWSYRGNGLQSQSLRLTSADANGFFTFTEVGPGTHLVGVAAPGFRKENLEGDSPGDLVVQLRATHQEGAVPGR